MKKDSQCRALRQYERNMTGCQCEWRMGEEGGGGGGRKGGRREGGGRMEEGGGKEGRRTEGGGRGEVIDSNSSWWDS